MYIGFLVGLLISINCAYLLTDFGDKLRAKMNDTQSVLAIFTLLIFDCTFFGYILSILPIIKNC
jgi:hypothetical protein